MFSKSDCKPKLRRCINVSTTGRSLYYKSERVHRKDSLGSNLLRLEGGDNQRKLKNLNREFERDISRLEASVINLTVSDKSLASSWIHKLKVRSPNLHEALARNYILKYLLQLSLFEMFSKNPFCKPPPQNNLSTIKEKMPPIVHNKKRIQELYQNSTDNGAFLNKLPVPRDGAFFVLHLRPNFK